MVCFKIKRNLHCWSMQLRFQKLTRNHHAEQFTNENRNNFEASKIIQDWQCRLVLLNIRKKYNCAGNSDNVSILLWNTVVCDGIAIHGKSVKYFLFYLCDLNSTLLERYTFISPYVSFPIKRWSLKFRQQLHRM